MNRAPRRETGAIYVNGWASAENPHAAGMYIGRNEMLHPDGTRGNYYGNKALVKSFGKSTRLDLATACRVAIQETHPAASRYASEVLWPAEFDDATRGRVLAGTYVPPTFEEWEAGQA